MGDIGADDRGRGRGIGIKGRFHFHVYPEDAALRFAWHRGGICVWSLEPAWRTLDWSSGACTFAYPFRRLLVWMAHIALFACGGVYALGHSCRDVCARFVLSPSGTGGVYIGNEAGHDAFARSPLGWIRRRGRDSRPVRHFLVSIFNGVYIDKVELIQQ